MKPAFKVFALLLGLLLMTAAGFFGARLWQSMEGGYTRVGAPGDCDLRAGPCERAVAGGRLVASITPREIPLMQPLQLDVRTEGLAAKAVTVEIRGLNMDMGLNRTPLVQDGDGHWRGETILPICSQRTMEWEAAVRVHAGERLEVPFGFRTTRP